MYKGPKRIAHRGNVVRAPENTWTAFQEAIFYGCDGIELDLRRSRDNRVVVMHDADCRRLSCEGPRRYADLKLSEWDWEDLQGVSLPFANHLMIDFSECPDDEMEMLRRMENIQLGLERQFPYQEAVRRDGRRERLILLEELLERLAAGTWRGLLELELKDSGLMDLLGPVLSDSPFKGEVFLMSSAEEIIFEIQDYYRRHPKPENVGLGANIRFLDEKWKARIGEMDLQEVNLNAWGFERAEIRYLEQRSIKVFSNLGDNHDWWAKCHKIGVYGIKTNYLEKYNRWWIEYGE